MPRYYAYMTGERVSLDSAAEGMPDESGWIDPSYSTFTIFENRNDVAPASVFTVSDFDAIDDRDEDTPDVATWVQNTIEEFLYSATHAEECTFYGEGQHLDWETGDVWTYALHFQAVDAILTGQPRDLTSEELGN